MLNRIIKLSLDNRIVVLVISALLMLAGIFVLFRTEVDIFPDLNAPTVAVMTEAPGMAPEEVERSVSFPIESAVNGASGVRRVRSSSASGFSVVWVEFDWGEDVYKARQTVSEKLAEVSASFPEGVGKPTLGPQSSILGEIFIAGFTSDRLDGRELREVVDRMVRPRLLSLGGVSQVSVIGGEEPEYQIRMNPERMREFGISLQEVSDAVGNLNTNVPGGVINEYGNEYLVKGDLSTTDMEEVAKCVVRNEGNGIVLLSDIAEVTPASKTPRLGNASIRGKSAVLVTVTKQPGAGSRELTVKILNELETLKKGLPAGIAIDTEIFRQSDFIDNSIGNLQSSLFEGALFVILVLFFFLMNLRTTLVSVVALPMSVLIAVLILYLMGQTINTMTLGGIAIAIGSLVDDAVVDVENVYSRLRRNSMLSDGKRLPVREVVFEASREVRLPILNSSFIIVASFLPLFFLSGIEGRMLRPLGISFIIALAASTLVALTLTPVLCSYLFSSPGALRSLSKENRFVTWLKGHYTSGLRKVLDRPAPIIWGTGILAAGALILAFTLGRSFLPSFNEGSFTINISALPGVSLETSDSVGVHAERLILSVPEVRNVARKTGRAELDEHSLGTNVSELEVPYVLDKGRSRREVAAELRHKLSSLPGVNVEIGQPISHRIDAMLSGSEAHIAIKVFGDDLEKLYATGSRIKQEISGIPGIVDVNVEQLVFRPQLDIRPRREMLAAYGITLAGFREFIETSLAGKTVGQVFKEGIPYDMTLRVDPARSSSREDIENLLIDTNQGKVPLSYVADVVVSSGPGTINREGTSRRIVVSANTDGKDLRGAVHAIQDKINGNVELPEGYFITYGGQFESEESASRTLAIATIGAIVLIFMFLFVEYKNLGQSLAIMVNMPLALIGGVFALVVTGSELNIPAIIGFISLMGICTRNGMLLISHYNHLERVDHVGLKERILTGSADRLNPIVMTALSSALALIPIAVRGGEPGNEIQAPLAIVILGGLVTSTFLNIYLVPLIYRWLCLRRRKRTSGGVAEVKPQTTPAE